MHPLRLGLNTALLLWMLLFAGLAKDNLLLLPLVTNMLDGEFMLLLLDNPPLF